LPFQEWEKLLSPRPNPHIPCNPSPRVEIKSPAEMVAKRWGKKVGGGGKSRRDF
jgi:hypothetical protein